MNAKILSGWRLLLGCWLLFAGQGMAHPILQNPMWIEVGPDLIKVKLYVSLRELSVVQGLPIAADGAVDGDLAAETAPRHSAYVLDHLSFRADGQPLTGKVSQIAPPKLIGKGVEGPDRAHFIYRLEYSLAQPPAQVSLSHTMVQEFPSAPGVPWDLSYTYRFGPPDATPLEFGSITRGAEVSYKTGFAQPAGTVPAAEQPVSTLPQLIRIALFGAAFGAAGPVVAGGASPDSGRAAWLGVGRWVGLENARIPCGGAGRHRDSAGECGQYSPAFGRFRLASWGAGGFLFSRGRLGGLVGKGRGGRGGNDFPGGVPRGTGPWLYRGKRDRPKQRRAARCRWRGGQISQGSMGLSADLCGRFGGAA